jgi:hypothetical protein
MKVVTRVAWLALPATLLVLAGCSSIGSISGAAAGVASGGASANPAVGIAVGIGVRALVDEGVNKLVRRWSDEEQSSIATQVGQMSVGDVRPWQVRHAVPYRDNDGQVKVVRAFETPLASCKEALFTVAGSAPAGSSPTWFATTACLSPKGWRWAAAEPAVSRWGALQ